MMNRKGLAITTLLAATVAATAGNPAPSTGQTPDGPGLTYGGRTDGLSAWLRLAPSRRAIASIEMAWSAAAERCSDGKRHLSFLYAGSEEYHRIDLRQDGTFRTTVVDRYTEEGTRYEEHQVLAGTIGPTVATGTISGRVRMVRPRGQVVRCTFGPQRWRLRN